VVFQDLAIRPWRTVKRNIAHGSEIAKVPKDEQERRVGCLTELMERTARAVRELPSHELSGGMKQRVAVADVVEPLPEDLSGCE